MTDRLRFIALTHSVELPPPRPSPRPSLLLPTVTTSSAHRLSFTLLLQYFIPCPVPVQRTFTGRLITGIERVFGGEGEEGRVREGRFKDHSTKTHSPRGIKALTLVVYTGSPLSVASVWRSPSARTSQDVQIQPWQ